MRPDETDIIGQDYIQSVYMREAQAEMSNVELLDFLSSVAEGSDVIMDAAASATMDQWENFDMELAMAVMEADVSGTDTTPSPSPPATSADCQYQTFQFQGDFNFSQQSDFNQNPHINFSNSMHTDFNHNHNHYAHHHHHHHHHQQQQHLHQHQQPHQLHPGYYNHVQEPVVIKQEPEHTSCALARQPPRPTSHCPMRAIGTENQQPLSAEDERKLRRREQNRMAARRCRERKKTARMGLVREYYELVSSNAELQGRIQRLEIEKQRLNMTLQGHATQCGLPYHAPD